MPFHSDGQYDVTNNPYCDCSMNQMYEQNTRSAILEESRQREKCSTDYVQQNYSANSSDFDETRRAMFESSRSKHNHRVAVSRTRQSNQGERLVNQNF